MTELGAAWRRRERRGYRVLAYYLRLLSHIPRHMLDATDKVANIFTLALLVIACGLILLNQPISTWFDAQWGGLAPWWVLAPIALYTIYQVALSNYHYVTAISQERNRFATLLEAREHRVESLARLVQLHERGDTLRHNLTMFFTAGEPYDGGDIGYEEWINDVAEAPRAMGETAKARLFVTSVPYPPAVHHNEMVNIVIQRLDRLGDIIKELEAQSSR